MFLWLATVALASDAGFLLRSEGAFDLANDRPGEDTAEVRTRMRGFMTGGPEFGDRWFLEVWGEHQFLSGDDMEGWWEVTPGPSGWHGKLGAFDVRAGHLIERWGKMDLLPPLLDVINPRDMSAGPMTPPEYLRLPLPMMVFATDLAGQAVRSETTLVPWAGADRVDSRGTDWSLMRQGMISSYTRGIEDWPCCFDDLGASLGTLGANIEDQDSRYRRGLNLAGAERNLPDALPLQGEVAQRFLFSWPGGDMSLTGAYLRTNQAAVDLDDGIRDIVQDELLPAVTELQTVLGGATSLTTNSWPRTWLAGLDASTMLGPIGVRVEGRWMSDQVARSKYIKSSTTPSVGAGLGLDWSYGTTLFVSAEARFEHMFDPPTTLLLSRRDQLTLAGTARASLLADKLRLSVLGIYDTTFGDWMAKPSVSYRPSDTWEITAGAVLIDGAVEAPKGLEDALSYGGGPGSYWSQNDAATLAVTWIK